MRRGFATIELPLVLLALLAAVGAGLLVNAVARHGGMTAGAWLGVALMAPFGSIVAWLVATQDKPGRPVEERGVDDAAGHKDA